MANETQINEKAVRILVDLLAHDINNHVHGALGYLELMEHILKEDPTVDRFMGNAMSEMRSVSHLVENVKTLITAPMEPFVGEPVDLYSQLVLAQENAQHRFDTKKLELVTMLKHGEVVLNADRFLQNALLEILSNSMRYDPLVEVHVWISAGFEGDNAVITIGDQGKGIPDDQKTIVMTRFWRSIKNEDAHGKGMGLSVVKMVMDRYGGEVQLENRVEGDHTQGTKIVLKLPLWKE
jgi:signal transduction histidine kinase